MLNFDKKYLIIAVLILLCLVPGSVAAYSNQITLDGRDDAGIYPGQDAFARFKVNYNGNSIGYQDVSRGNMGDQWTQASQVSSYFDTYLRVNDESWSLQSAGNIISPDIDYTVGDSLSGLSAGTYRISPLDGAYMYDAFGWGGYANKYWWKVFVIATDNTGYHHDNPGDARGYILGSTGVLALDVSSLLADLADYDRYSRNSDFSGAFDSPTAAFNAVQNRHLDISLEEGGSLYFWIWDWNSIDNSGAISLNVTYVPEPSTLVLLTIGLFFLIYRNLLNRLGLRYIGIAPKEK